MRFFLILSFIFLSSCEHKKSISEKRDNVSRELSKIYTQEDKELAQCAQSVYKNCSGTKCFQKAQSQCLAQKFQRNPASSMQQIQAQAMIENNGWFFLNPSIIENFYNFIQAIKKAQKQPEGLKKVKNYLSNAFHGRGIGITGSFFMGANKGWSAELINHRNEVALFCAPHNGIVSDAGMNAGAVAVTTLGCGSNKSYEGTFISLSLGISGELFLVPAGAELAYSFGVNSDVFNQAIREIKNNGKLDLHELKNEIMILQTHINGQYPFLLHSLKAFTNFLFHESDENSISEFDLTAAKSLLLRKSSLGGIIKSFYYSNDFREMLEKYQFKQLDKILGIFAKSLTGCDSIAGSAALSLSASPIAFGLTQSYYTNIISLDKEDLKKLGTISLAGLANPILLSPVMISTILKYAFQINRLDYKIRACLSADIKDFENFVNFKN